MDFDGARWGRALARMVNVVQRAILEACDTTGRTALEVWRGTPERMHLSQRQIVTNLQTLKKLGLVDHRYPESENEYVGLAGRWVITEQGEAERAA
jgi:hypothetical protein